MDGGDDDLAANARALRAELAIRDHARDGARVGVVEQARGLSIGDGKCVGHCTTN